MSYLKASSFYGNTASKQIKSHSLYENIKDEKLEDSDMNDYVFKSQFSDVCEKYYKSPEVRVKLREERLNRTSPFSKRSSVLKGTLSCETPRKSRPLKRRQEQQTPIRKYLNKGEGEENKMQIRLTLNDENNKSDNLIENKRNSIDSSSTPQTEKLPLKLVTSRSNTIENVANDINIDENNKENYIRSPSLLCLSEGSADFQQSIGFYNNYEAEDYHRQPGDPLPLKNLGNTCYMNSIVQSLFVLKGFFSDLCEKFKFVKLKSPNGEMTKSLINLYNEYEKRRKPNENIELKTIETLSKENIDESLNNLKTCVGEKSTQFKLNIQQDAVEFVDLILSTIEEEFDKTKPSLDNGENFNPIHKYFQLIIETKLNCIKCDRITILPKLSLHTIYLSVPANNNNRFTLQNVVENYFKEESFEHKCDNAECIGKSKLRKQIIVKYPKILFLQLARYSEDGTKRHEIIYVPNQIILPNISNDEIENKPFSSNCINKENTKECKKVYRLIAAICHHGNSLTGGHYVSYVNQEKSWFFCDDDVITKVNLEKTQEGVKTSGYCFFYINEQFL